MEEVVAMNNNRSSRHQNKEKKVNRLYNVLIAVVAVLIVFIGGSLILGGGSDETSPEQNTEQTPKSENNNDTEKNTPEENTEEPASDEEADENATDDEATEQEESSDVEVEENPEPGVESRTVDPSWEPVGTEQGEKPAATYEKGSTDWNEMLAAVGAGVGVNPNDMTVWRLGNNGAPEKAVATVSPKGEGSVKYRVEIEWVENEGWKPTVVEKLS